MTVQTPATHTDSYALIKSWGEYVRKGEYEILIDTAKTYYRKAIANHDKKTQAYVGAYIGQAYILSGQADSMFTYFNAAKQYDEDLLPSKRPLRYKIRIGGIRRGKQTT